MPSRSRRQPLARRAIAALLAGLWLSGLVGSIFHGDRDEHRYCVEHGAFEEVGSKPADQAAPVARASAELLAAGTAVPERHQECAFVDAGVRTPLEQPSLHHVRVPAPASAAPTLTLATFAPPIPLLAFAPKSSPPAFLV